MLLNNMNASITSFHFDSITVTEGVHRAINTPKTYEKVTEKFYTSVLGVQIKGKVNSADALYMPWIIGKIPDSHNLLSDNDTIEGPQLLLLNFHGFQFVYSLAED